MLSLSYRENAKTLPDACAFKWVTVGCIVARENDEGDWVAPSKDATNDSDSRDKLNLFPA